MCSRANDSQLSLSYAPSSGVRDHRSLDAPPSIRSSSTSRYAAGRIARVSCKMVARVLGALRDAGRFGMTDEELQIHLSMPGNSERPRRIHLVEKGLVVDSGNLRPTASGRQAVVWIAAEAS